MISVLHRMYWWPLRRVVLAGSPESQYTETLYRSRKYSSRRFSLSMNRNTCLSASTTQRSRDIQSIHTEKTLSTMLNDRIVSISKWRRAVRLLLVNGFCPISLQYAKNCLIQQLHSLAALISITIPLKSHPLRRGTSLFQAWNAETY